MPGEWRSDLRSWRRVIPKVIRRWRADAALQKANLPAIEPFSSEGVGNVVVAVAHALSD